MKIDKTINKNVRSILPQLTIVLFILSHISPFHIISLHLITLIKFVSRDFPLSYYIVLPVCTVY